MQEFMLLIRNQIGQHESLSPEEQQEFLKKCMVYIENLNKEGKLKKAQPMARQGKIVSGGKGAWKEGPFNEATEVIVGYYHILAKDMDEAIAIAKGNPEFEYGKTARVEVRPIKMMEETTGYIYPGKS